MSSNAFLFATYSKLRDALNEVELEIERRDIDWRHLAEHGFTIEAIKKYRRLNGCTLMEAKDAVEAYLRS